MSFELPKLPYAKDALTPYMSAETFDYHYSKHHQGYVNKLNAAVEGTGWASKSLDEIVKTAKAPGVFNNAAQHWNHSFFWKCLKPGGGGAPTGRIATLIDRDFGSYDAFKAQFAKVAGGQFGSGWGWLVLDGDKLVITSTSNAGNPLTEGLKPLFTVDVWEHAYYIDYRNDRGGFIGKVLDNLASWDFVNDNLAG